MAVVAALVPGKTVESVPRGVRARMRRPRTADSYEEGMRKPPVGEEARSPAAAAGGLAWMYRGGGGEAAETAAGAVRKVAARSGSFIAADAESLPCDGCGCR